MTDPPLAHIARDDIRRAVAIAAERAFEIAAGIVENVAAAPVDELEEAQHRVAKAEAVADRLVDVLGAGDAFLDHPRRLVHGQRLDARDDEAGRGGAHHRHLADAFEQALDAVDNRRIGRLARRDFHQRNEIGRIEPVCIEKPPRMCDGAGEIVDQDGRGGGSDDHVCRHEARRIAEHLALEVDNFGNALEYQP